MVMFVRAGFHGEEQGVACVERGEVIKVAVEFFCLCEPLCEFLSCLRASWTK